MKTGGKALIVASATIVVAASALTPATGSHKESQKSAAFSVPRALSFDMFTPAAADAKLAAHVAQTVVPTATHFAFTPVSSAERPAVERAITVAVRVPGKADLLRFVQPIRPVESQIRPGSEARDPADLGLAPGSYRLGTSVGWKSFAQHGSKAETELGILQGGSKSANVGVNQQRLTPRIQVATERPDTSSGQLNVEKRTTLDVGYAYRLNRKLDLTAGVRYKAERDRLDRVPDAQRDSKAVYIGTQIRF